MHTETKQIQHYLPSGKKMSAYELFVKYETGKRFRDQTFRGDNELEKYKTWGYKIGSQLEALIFKLRNIRGVKCAYLYDNTKEIPRNLVLEIDNGELKVNHLKNFTL